jgi:hypothetical protein
MYLTARIFVLACAIAALAVVTYLPQLSLSGCG